MRGFIATLITLALFNSCKEDVIVETIPPEVGTTTAFIFGDSIRLTSVIVSLGSLPIKEHGFAISTSNPPILGNDFDVIVPTLIKSNVFSINAINELHGEAQYFIAGFIKTKDDIVYGSIYELDGSDRNPPFVASVEPTHAYKGDLIKITGSNFHLNKDQLKVTFGTLEAEIISSTTNQISVKVPDYFNAGVVDLVVEKAGRSSSVPFTLDGPIISSFNPPFGIEKFEFNVQGSGFSQVPWRNTVNLSTIRNGKPIRFTTQVMSASSSQLTVRVDASNMLPGPYQLSIIVDRVRTVATTSFEIKTPWHQLQDKPASGVGGSANFEINGKLYVCTGTSASNSSGYTNELWEYNLSTDEWTRKADFPGGGRIDAFAFSINGKGYLGSGLMPNNESPSDLWQYDPNLDVWTQKTGIPGAPRTRALSFTHNNEGYVIFGTEGAGWPKRKDFWSYNPDSDSWTQLPDFGGNARLQSALSIKNNMLFVIGGFDSNTVFKSDSWSYNFATQQWSFIDYVDFQPQSYFFNGERCYILSLGFNYFLENELNLFEYDPETNTKTSIKALFPGAFRWIPGLSLMRDNKLYLGLGAAKNNFDYLNDLWIYPL